LSDGDTVVIVIEASSGNAKIERRRKKDKKQANIWNERDG